VTIPRPETVSSLGLSILGAHGHRGDTEKYIRYPKIVRNMKEGDLIEERLLEVVQQYILEIMILHGLQFG
jgi:hypothetical protein